MLRLVRKPKQISLKFKPDWLKKTDRIRYRLDFEFLVFISITKLFRIVSMESFQAYSIDRFPFLSGNGEPLASDDQPSERQQPNEYATRRIRRLFRRFILHTHIWCCHCSKNSIVLYVFSADPILLLLVSVIAYQVEKLSQVSGMKKLSQVSGRNTRSSVR